MNGNILYDLVKPACVDGLVIYAGALVKAVVAVDGHDIMFEGKGNGPIDAFVKGMNEHSELNFSLQSYSEHDIDHGSSSRAAAYIGIKKKSGRSAFGVGIDANINLASIKAILCALNRLEE